MYRFIKVAILFPHFSNFLQLAFYIFCLIFVISMSLVNENNWFLQSLDFGYFRHFSERYTLLMIQNIRFYPINIFFVLQIAIIILFKLNLRFNIRFCTSIKIWALILFCFANINACRCLFMNTRFYPKWKKSII